MSGVTTQAPGAPAVSPSAAFLRDVSHDFARRHLVLSAGGSGGAERLLVAGSTDAACVHNVGVRLGAPVRAEVVDAEWLARAIDGAYAGAREAGPGEAEGAGEGEAEASIEALLAEADRDLLSTDGKGPVVRLVDALLFDALGRGASDLHVQPLADRTLVRVRVDGVLQVVREIPRGVTAAVVSRVKVMGRMDIAERRVPQDGRATVTIGRSGGEGDAEGGGRTVDLRISTLPTSHGERVVVRLLDTGRGLGLCDFDTIGMPPDVRGPYLSRAARPNGIVLLTGPTGSGKTTTLYATLRWIATRASAGMHAGGLNIMTVEDPIEYELSGPGIAISQAQVNTRKGVTFASGLRHILRQDPDVVMVGEIRDAETARTAIQASLTGHLVFSTLHTNDAASAVARLVDLGVEPYLVSASLSAVLAQRLVRTRHGVCGGEGCEGCLGSGYLGRTGIFELLAVDERVRSLITAGAAAGSIRSAARTGGMRTLREDGARLVRAGVTSELEVERVAADVDTSEDGGG